MRRLLCAIAANRHRAPAPGMSARPINKHQRTAVPFASLHASEILIAYKLGHRPCDRKQQGVGGSPPTLSTPYQPRDRRFTVCRPPGFFPLDLAHSDLAKLLVSCKDPVQRLQLLKSLRLQRPAPMRLHESAEPLPQFARLSRDTIKFARHNSLAQLRYRLRRHHAGSYEPRNQLLARSDPLDLSVDGSRNRIEKIEPRRIRDEDRRRTLIDHRNRLEAQSGRCNRQYGG